MTTAAVVPMVNCVRRSCDTCGPLGVKIVNLPYDKFYSHWLESEENKCEKCGSKCLTIPIDLDYCDKLIEEYQFKTLRDTEEIWYYTKDTGNYLENAEIIIKERVEFEYKDKISPPISQIIGHIQRRTYVNRTDFNPSVEWLACDNCMINVKTGETKPFSPEFMNTTLHTCYL